MPDPQGVGRNVKQKPDTPGIKPGLGTNGQTWIEEIDLTSRVEPDKIKV